jgi:hypothetical protein
MKLLPLLILLAIASCSSRTDDKKKLSEPTENVISRIDGLSSRPNWLTESEPFKVENGSVVSLGQTTIPANHRVEAAFRIAENNAKSSISSAIEQRLDFIFQNAEEGTAMDSTQARFIGAEASKMTTSDLRLKNRYWEKVYSIDENGQTATTYKVFATVSMSEPEFKRAVMEAIRKAQGKGGLSSDFAGKVDQHWNQFTNYKEDRKRE